MNKLNVPDASIPCAKSDSCGRLNSLRDHDWAGDWQYAEAVDSTCRDCTDRDRSEVLWRREHFLGYKYVQIERTNEGLVVITDESRRFALEAKDNAGPTDC